MSFQTLLHRSETAWQNADFSAFASLWDFNVTDYVPSETEWKERLQQQAESGSRWQSQIESVNKQNFIAVTVAVSSFTWKGRHKVLRVEARTIGLLGRWNNLGRRDGILCPAQGPRIANRTLGGALGRDQEGQTSPPCCPTASHFGGVETATPQTKTVRLHGHVERTLVEVVRSRRTHLQKFTADRQENTCLSVEL